MTGGRTAHVAERKLVTLLFADLTGFTALCETLDPEDVTERLLPAMNELRGVVESYGGTVVQVSGDGFFAVFGAPRAQEDHAERAVRAALTAVERAAAQGDQVPLPGLHAGVNTGDVFFTPSDDRAGFTVYGDAVNVASRLCSMAKPAQVLAGQRTRALSGDAILYAPARKRAVKGKQEPVPVSLAIRPRAPLPAPRTRHDDTTPFVGRDGALRALRSAAADVAGSGWSRTVLVTGDAGIGKSRLAHEFSVSFTGEPGTEVLMARCTPYGATLPLAALAEAIERRARDDEAAFAEHVRVDGRRLASLWSHDAAGGEREDAPSVVRSVFEGMAERGSVVVIVDDAHWADPDLLTFLNAIASVPWDARVMVAVFSREPAPRLLAGLDAMRLESLPDDAIRSLVRSRLPSLAPGVAGRIADRAAGNPLYCEELVGMLLEAGALQFVDGVWTLLDDGPLGGVPESLGALIADRIDTLEPETKKTLQYAAVCGPDLSESLLTELQPDGAGHIARLKQSGLLATDEERIEIRHPLIRDVAERSLPKRERAVIHARIGDWLRKQGGDDEEVDAIAYHFERSHQLGGGGDVTANAVAYLSRSARAAFRHQARSAQALYLRALSAAEAGGVAGELCAEAMAGHAEALLELGRHADATRDASRARELAPKSGRPDLVARTLLVEGASLSNAGRVARARPLLVRARRSFAVAGDVRGVAEALHQLAGTYRLDDMQQCVDVLRQAREAALESGDRWSLAQVTQELALVLSATGGEEFAERYAEATTLIGDDANLRMRASLLRTGAYRALLTGDYPAAAERAAAARGLAMEAGALGIDADARLVDVAALTSIGPPDRAVRAAQEILPIARRLRSNGLKALALLAQAVPLARSGNPSSGAARVASARRILEASRQPAQLAEADLAAATLALDRGRWDRVAEHAAAAERRARSIGFTAYVPLAKLHAARALLGAGDLRRARRAFAATRDAAMSAGAVHLAGFAEACEEQAVLLSGADTGPVQARPVSPEHRAVAAENQGIRAAGEGRTRLAARRFAEAAQQWALIGQTVWPDRTSVLAQTHQPALP